MLPRGSGKASRHVTKRARENDGNPMKHANPNPILDSRQYFVEFEYGTDAELTANTISQSMYAQCYPDGNQYLMLDYIVDFRLITTTLCCADQNFIKTGLTYRLRSLSDWQLC